MKDLFHFLDLNHNDKVLDLGCSSGYITFEVSKKVKNCIGVDIKEKFPQIPKSLKHKLKFISYSGDLDELSLDTNSFDTILISELLMAIQDLDRFLYKLRNFLKSDGKIIILNGLERPFIKSLYNKKSFASFCQFINFPNSYDNYASSLLGDFRSVNNYLDYEKVILDSLNRNNYIIKEKIYTPYDTSVIIIEILQFICVSLNLRTNHLNNPLIYLSIRPLCCLLSLCFKSRNLNFGLLLSAKLK